MKKLGYLTAALLLLLTLSCGGGGSPTTPGTIDLAGLEGVWDMDTVWTGKASLAGEKVPINDTWNADFNITKTAVTELVPNGPDYTWVWDYNGNTLTLSDAFSGTVYIDGYGDCYSTGTGKLYITLQPGATIGNVTGRIESITMISDEKMELLIDVAGKMTKR